MPAPPRKRQRLSGRTGSSARRRSRLRAPSSGAPSGKVGGTRWRAGGNRRATGRRPRAGRSFARRPIKAGRFSSLRTESPAGPGAAMRHRATTSCGVCPCRCGSKPPGGIAGGDSGSSRAFRDYQRALSDYSAMLNGVGSDTLKEVSETWQARAGDGRYGCGAAEAIRPVRGCRRTALPRCGVERGVRRSRRPIDQYPRRPGGRCATLGGWRRRGSVPEGSGAGEAKTQRGGHGCRPRRVHGAPRHRSRSHTRGVARIRRQAERGVDDVTGHRPHRRRREPEGGGVSRRQAHPVSLSPDDRAPPERGTGTDRLCAR